MSPMFSVRLGWLALCLAGISSAAEFKFPNHTLTVPDGFTVELVAGPPLVDRPIVADFDEQGRLYVADSSGLSDKAEKHLEEKPHRIVRLEDTDGDGIFDKSVVFADKMMFPEGILWYDGAVYSGAPPIIWKLQDTDGDGIADQRTEWHDGKTLTGCANDLHGPYLGPDGWIYWAKGAFAKQTYERPGLPAISDSAAHIFRCRPDKSAFDSLMSGGMDNPVEVAFSPEGEAFFTTTFYAHPQSGERDALVHAIYGGVYPKPHGVLDGLKRTGDLMPPLTHLGPAVPSGLACYASQVFGDDYQGNLFSTHFNLRRVQRHVLVPNESGFRTVDSDFLVSDNHDFHPTDVLEDADGSLLILDTGGWYKICCPSSQISKPEVLGAIYRVRKAGAPKVAHPRGLDLPWDRLRPGALTRLLDDRRPAVRQRAIEQLGKLGEVSVAALNRVVSAPESRAAQASQRRAEPSRLRRLRNSASTTDEARRNAVWALTRIDSPAARAGVRLALSDPDPSVQQAAIHSAGMHRDPSAVPDLLTLLGSENLHLKRNTATALGRIGDKTAVAALLAETEISRDRLLEHALIYALIEINDRNATLASLHAPSASTRRAALLALDQMDSGRLAASDVLPYLNSGNAVLKATASFIVSLHSDWGEAMTGYYRQALENKTVGAKEREELKQQLVQFTRSASIQQLLAEVLRKNDLAEETRLLALQVMEKAPVREIPAAWSAELRRCLAEANEQIVKGAVLAVRALPIAKTNAIEFLEPLLALSRDAQRPEELRLAALSAAPGGLNQIDPEILAFLQSQLNPQKPPADRTAAATILGKTKLNDEQQLALADSIQSAGPMELSRLLGAFENATNEALGLKLVAALKNASALRSVRPDQLKTVLAKFPPSVQAQGEDLFRILDVDLAQQKARVDEYHGHLQGGDRDRGRRIFESSKTACSTCHQVGYLGGKAGPDLTRIGSVRTELDLLESILFPNSNFVRSYEPVVVETRDGEQYSGVLRHESAESVVLVTGAGAEQRLAMADVAAMRPSSVSIMPGGLDEQLTKQDMADLIAFLKSLR